jgi:hypothetical protein
MKMNNCARLLSTVGALALLATSVASASILRTTPRQVSHTVPAIHAIGVRPQTTCPSAYFVCVEVTPGSPASVGICFGSVTSGGNCNPAAGTWSWTSKGFLVKKGHITKKRAKSLRESFSPNPGNPTTDTIDVKKCKNSHGKIVLADVITVVNSAGSSATGDIGISCL